MTMRRIAILGRWRADEAVSNPFESDTKLRTKHWLPRLCHPTDWPDAESPECVAQVAANEKQRPSDALSQDVNNTRRHSSHHQVSGQVPDQQASGPSSSSPPLPFGADGRRRAAADWSLGLRRGLVPSQTTATQQPPEGTFLTCVTSSVRYVQVMDSRHLTAEKRSSLNPPPEWPPPVTTSHLTSTSNKAVHCTAPPNMQMAVIR